MSLEIDVHDILGAIPLGEQDKVTVSGRQPTTRLDINTVISRIYDDNNYPLISIKGNIYSFTRYSITRTGNLVEIKYFQW